jgi:hypothetical protein
VAQVALRYLGGERRRESLRVAGQLRPLDEVIHSSQTHLTRHENTDSPEEADQLSMMTELARSCRSQRSRHRPAGHDDSGRADGLRQLGKLARSRRA